MEPRAVCRIESAGALAHVNHHPVNSIEEFFFPKHQKLYGYEIKGNDVQLTEAAEPCWTR